MMGNKTRNTNYDVLDKILADSNQAQRMGGANHSSSYADSADGSWVTSKEQFDQLYKSVSDLEKYLRS